MHGDHPSPVENRRNLGFFRDRVRLAIGAFVFTLGVVFLLLAELVTGSEVISTGFANAGSLLAGSIALTVLYEVFVKPSGTAETVSIVDERVREPLTKLVSEHQREARAAVDDLSRPIQELLDSQQRLLDLRVSLSLDGSVSAGFLGVLPALDFGERLFGGLGEGDELLWLDTYCPALGSAAEDPLFEAVLNGASIKMLAIDPEAENCAARADEIQELPFSADRFRKEARNGLERLEEHSQEIEVPSVDPAGGSLEVRLYRGLPCVPMYLHLRNRRLQAGYSGFFLTRATYHEPHVAWAPSGPDEPEGFLERFETYFRHRWKLASNPEDRFMVWPPEM